MSACAFDLPGCGSDHTPRADLRLADAVAALLTAIDNLPPGSVRVVGHSIGGWLLPYAAAERRRVSELVYVAAVTLRRGERGIDMIPDGRRQTYFDLAAASGDNSILGEFEPTWHRFFGSVDEATARSWYARLTPQPFGPYLDPVELGVDDVAVASRYIGATRERNFSAAQISSFADKVGVAVEPVEGDHCMMLTNPDALVARLLDGG